MAIVTGRSTPTAEVRETAKEAVPTDSETLSVARAKRTVGGSSSSRMVPPMVSAGSPVLNFALRGSSRTSRKLREPS
jgi:hypothetical protein